MIEDLKNSLIIDKVGGKFKLSALIQKRMLELMQGARPLITDTEGRTAMEIAVSEIVQDKLTMDFDSGESKTAPAKKPLL